MLFGLCWGLACGPGSTDSDDEPVIWPSNAVVLPDVTVVDVDGARGPVTVVLDGPSIATVLDGTPEPPADATVLPVAGSVVVPGLIDPHVHLFLSGAPWFVGDTLAANLRATLAAGITTAVDAGGPLNATALRDRIDEQRVVGPDLRVLGPMLTVEASHPCETLYDPVFCTFVEDAEDAVRAAQIRNERELDGMKVALADGSGSPWPTPRLPVPWLQDAVAAGPELVYAHVASEQDALDAVDAGVAHLTHPVFGGPPSVQAALTLAAKAQAIHTTLGAFSGTLDLLDGRLGPELAADPRVADAWQWVIDNPESVDPLWRTASEQFVTEAETSIGLLDDAGANLLVASDAGYVYVPHGWGLHREMARLVSLGWTHERVFHSVTAHAATALGLVDRGRVSEGLRADLLVVAGDPREDSAVLARPSYVVMRGVVATPAGIAEGESLLEPASGGVGSFCLDDRDCEDARCDRVLHRCDQACEFVGQLEDPCGPQAWCSPAEGLTGEPVCQTVRTCNLYDRDSCAPDPYRERCVPLDFDTAGCFQAGTAKAGETCDPYAIANTCEPGLYCSLLDETCYTLCNPALPDTCPEPYSCEWQGPMGARWFGLCR